MDIYANNEIFEGALDLIISLDEDYTYFDKKNKDIGFENPLYKKTSHDRNSSIESRQITDVYRDKDGVYNRRVIMKFGGNRWSLKADTFAKYKKLQNIFLPYIILFSLILILVLVFKVDIFLGTGSESHKKHR